MATVHPSRLGLVPNAQVKRSPAPLLPSREEELRRKLAERRRWKEDGVEEDSGDRRSGKDGRYDGDIRDVGRRDKEYRGDGRRDHVDRRLHEDGDPRRERNRSRSRDRDRYPRRRSPSPRAANVRYDRRDTRSPRDTPDRSRRPSPSYRPYDGPPPRTGESMPLNGSGGSRYGYGPSNGGGAPLPVPPFGRGGIPPFPPTRGTHQGGWMGPTGFERRRIEREIMTLSVWPPSPKAPYRDDDELEVDRKAKRKAKKAKAKSSKRSKKRYSDSDSSSTDSEDERRQRRRIKGNERERRSRRYPDDEEEEERQRKKRRSEEKRPKSDSEEDVADQWVEKGGEVALAAKDRDLARLVVPLEPVYPLSDDDEDDKEVGPHLPVEHSAHDKHRRSAYTNMFKGEGEAMAAYAASGQRIPRRGEIGLDSNQIEAFETSGYVMSGSRHRRMNAVRMRKENQVINAEEKRAILNLQREEKIKKEGAIVSQFREMLEERLTKEGVNKP